MRSLVVSFIFLFSGMIFAQSEDLADEYFKRGEFEKALISYQKLYETKRSSKLVYKIVGTLQQLERYDDAEATLRESMKIFKFPAFLVELGYNYQLKDSLNQANSYYRQALDEIPLKPTSAYTIAKKFQDHSLLEEALEAYELAMEANPKMNFNIQMARIYGELGNIELLFSNYLDYVSEKPSFLSNAKRAFSDFISENKENENNLILRKLLLKKIQSQPDPYWYDFLSWLYIQQKEYNKAFTQEKALYRRTQESLSRIIDLAMTTINEEDYEVSNSIFNYILENSQDIDTRLTAHQYLLEIEIATSNKSDLDVIDQKFNDLFDQYGTYEQTIALQIAYGNFLAFNKQQPKIASTFLKKSLKLNLSPFQEATVKLKLGDILVFQERFNEALIYYSQIQVNLKNSTISQEARFKVAKTSYYKGDFDWAESQLKILKSSTSQLIANDALDLKLLISDNKDEDSLRTALKLYSKADLMAFQNNNDEAIALIDKILTEHKGESIEDQALFMQAKLFEKTKQLEKAEACYQYIIANYRNDILADDALYFLADLYQYQLSQPEKAKELYEKILFNHEDSIYFIESRKRFRMLRGDAIN
ncbi:tetratricopeptide repeat protein [Psychroserpens sp.]|uniref:tetratricopeptide repeat protein n=1 Tax=Psychroserpens sp. TaxID=2020870 RepID=UPI001B0F115D|nr:tetratricopeptide repeat protein [Psychroserpens sp.]MBO6607731.1 tetratricopeptide repeat protein [Psychroserpens sp.]MBO6654722.1 tetratricopeptide repeat protein [Psychroserpens sp.]MBO6682854.1 tetratricopeptide repeat protein [Psychroserpens sp.]MBO6751089.1 tetratricopeptide repeat protein [Psychroserpens sp.]MBO6916342.1 tetratricopeptide repeat protein [Psychroserpens sp.]